MTLHRNARTCPNSRRLIADRVLGGGWTLAGRLVVCLVRRLTGNDEATPDTAPGVLPITVQVSDDTDVPALAERLRDECAAELGISEPWELVGVLRP